ncbi:RagB/SusD family nutrient uptake outer membrane protein [Pontibacter qinzhouensis]|uniref:RagB/SusD family nutrient uptake outer membrane protein n=1 Tax=Pontibacter qinzhouensis TaxID=2603253 RepID=A0A5C8KCE0_9BACT|nr:RagB/SusD family nutrient uptake outer membrane protein [Pontibacter qinzhouensis]TXK49229.1 RagB/SusD family nutrient uptake outer membrane protein [Pontibacter qinzhouensis]
MKSIYAYQPLKKQFLVVLLLLGFSSCEEFLNVKPAESVSDEVTIVNKLSAETAVRGVYSALASGSYYGTSFQSIGYLSGDNVQWTGSQSQVQEFINHQVNAENSTIGSAWVAIYRTINRANNVISKVPAVADPTFTQEQKNQLVGEAYFIRALAYFDLARTFGGVPIITAPTISPTDNRGIARASVDETYAQVLSDLEAAEPLLSLTTDRYRATRKTVWALKARYYLYRQNWEQAEEFASKLISDSDFRLLKPYSAFFAGNVRGTQESVFEVFYNGTTEVNGHRNQWQPQANGGTRQWAPSDAVIALLNNPEIGGNRNVLVAQDNQNRWYGTLYYRTPGSDPSYIFRIAELYLIRAEARAQRDNLAGAKADLDAVRDRAGLAGAAAASKADLLLAIEDERRVEFAQEPHRWFDLVRTGRAPAVLNISDENRLVLPIPIDQLLADKALQQNLGY